MSPNPEILSENEITMSETASELEKIKARDKELNFRGQKAEEYLSHFVKLDSKKAAELEKKLLELAIPRLKEGHIRKIIDLMPHNLEDLKMILSGFSITISNENLKKLIGIVVEYRN